MIYFFLIDVKTCEKVAPEFSMPIKFEYSVNNSKAFMRSKI